MLGLFPCQLLSTLFHASYWLADVVIDSHWFQLLTYKHCLVNKICHSTMEQGHPTIETTKWISTYLQMETEFTHMLNFGIERETLIYSTQFIILLYHISQYDDSLNRLYDWSLHNVFYLSWYGHWKEKLFIRR